MKKIFLLIIISVFVDGCEKGNFLVNPKHEYSFIAKVDNEYWQGNCYLYLTIDQKQTLFLEPDNHDGYLYIELKFHGIGEYPIIAPTTALVETVGGDVLSGVYYPLSGQNYTLKIDYYDKDSGIIEGIFNFKIKKRTSIIDFSNGIFKANILKQKQRQN